jgi:3-hydroxybutyryl-CoA dehydrogenase
LRVEQVGVVGAGTMGAGIAQLACLGRFETYLHDPFPEALEDGEGRVRAGLVKGAERGRWSAEEAEAASARLRTSSRLEDLGGCDLLIEAAPEDLGLKRELFARLAGICGDDALLATNTSSLPVSAIAEPLAAPERVLGMHFFNPPARMRLVEVVAGDRTAPATLDAATAVAERMGRTPVRCTDSPGFIVNRCNRPFTLESLRILDEGIVDHAQIDRVVREDGGYPMGPFELMDLIGIDVNLEVARSFYRQRPEPRWRPHPIQERMVRAGRLGRKSGRGFYDYAAGADEEAVAMPDSELRGAIIERIIAQLVNEACFAAGEGVAAPEDIDEAMRLGLNHPRGPFEWGREFGPERVLATLAGLGAGEAEIYRPAPLLERWAASGDPDPPVTRSA